MPTWTDGGDVFDGVADSYEAYRPGFPTEVFTDIGETIGLSPRSNVVEVGSGTGLATARLVEFGADVLAIEHGAALAAATAGGLRPDRRLCRVRQASQSFALAPVCLPAIGTS